MPASRRSEWPIAHTARSATRSFAQFDDVLKESPFRTAVRAAGLTRHARALS